MRTLTLAMILFVPWLGWRVTTLGMADYYTQHQPESALRWRANTPHALRRLSVVASDGGALDHAADLARRAIRVNPLDGRAYAALARAEAVDKVPDIRLATIAAQRWPLDLSAHAVLIDHHLRTGQLEAALPHYDALLRIQPTARARVFPLLLELLVNLHHPEALGQWLGQGPPWRVGFLRYAARAIDNPAPMHRVMQALQTTNAPPNEGEMRAWLARLERDARFTDAWFTWAQSLPPERLKNLGNLHNGSFEWPASGYGFDWRFERVAGASIEQVAGGIDADTALRVAFQYQRVNFRHVSQLLLLPAGAFELTGRVRLDALRNERGLVWVVECATSPARRLGTSEPLRGVSPWREFRFHIDVPPANCPAQWLRLQLDARAVADRFIGGEAWFDALAIRRL